MVVHRNTDARGPQPAAADARHGTGAGLRPAPAAVAACLGVLTLGVLALLRVASPALDRWLTWRPAAEMVGPGAIATAVWLGSWLFLGALWHPTTVSRRTAAVCLILIALGVLLAFPPLDQLLA
jgi:hypothetical protein